MTQELEKALSDAFDRGAVTGVNSLVNGIKHVVAEKPNITVDELMVAILVISEMYKNKLNEKAI